MAQQVQSLFIHESFEVSPDVKITKKAFKKQHAVAQKFFDVRAEVEILNIDFSIKPFGERVYFKRNPLVTIPQSQCDGRIYLKVDTAGGASVARDCRVLNEL